MIQASAQGPLACAHASGQGTWSHSACDIRPRSTMSRGAIGSSWSAALVVGVTTLASSLHEIITLSVTVLRFLAALPSCLAGSVLVLSSATLSECIC